MSDTPWDTDELSRLDKRHVWHPFTPMADWLAEDHEPIFLVAGRGAWLTDSRGRRYLDGNSSIWTNIHGHAHPKLVATIANQAATLAHASFLGFSNPWAVKLAARLAGYFPGTSLGRVFFTDNGSTAIECALKMAVQCRQLRGENNRVLLASFDDAYHGDTLGAASVSGVSAFTQRFNAWGWKPLRLAGLDDLYALDPEVVAQLNAIVIEPLIQGVNRMRLWPAGLLRELRTWCDEQGVFLILDEVMTGFGRTGRMFACEHEQVIPDFLCLAKGITGGTLPLAATLVSENLFESFLGDGVDPRTFYYGHSYCANPLGCAVALASLDLFEEEQVLQRLPAKIKVLGDCLNGMAERLGQRVGEIRQLGMIAAMDIRDASGRPFAPELRMGAKVCAAAREFGVLTRPILDTLVVMPPLCIDEGDIRFLCDGLAKAVEKVIPTTM